MNVLYCVNMAGMERYKSHFRFDCFPDFRVERRRTTQTKAIKI